MIIEDISIAYSYERVTPGKDYYKSIKTFNRNYSGYNLKSKNLCKKFLIKILKKKKIN